MTPDETENEITLPSELDRGPNGECLCPADDCDFSRERARSIPQHYYHSHDNTIADDLFGEDTWIAYLRQEHVGKGLAPSKIARAFGPHIGETRIREDLREYDLYFHLSTGNIPESAWILLHPDVTTIAEAQRVAAKRRGEL